MSSNTVTPVATASGVLSVYLLSTATPTYVPSVSPGYNDCYVCVLNSGKYCYGNTVAFSAGTLSNYCGNSAVLASECSNTLITTLEDCAGKVTSTSGTTVTDTATSSSNCNFAYTPTGTTTLTVSSTNSNVKSVAVTSTSTVTTPTYCQVTVGTTMTIRGTYTWSTTTSTAWI